MLIKVIRLAFTGFFGYASKQHNKSNSFLSIHFEGGLLVYPGELIIDRISSHTRGVSRLPWSDIFLGLQAYGLGEKGLGSLQAAVFPPRNQSVCSDTL